MNKKKRRVVFKTKTKKKFIKRVISARLDKVDMKFYNFKVEIKVNFA